MKSIDFEAHFFTTTFINYLKKRDINPRLIKLNEPSSYNIQFTDDVALFHGKTLLDKLCDLGQGRIDQMDKVGLDIQILSATTPGADSISDDPEMAMSMARDSNDELADAIKRHPTRLKGFAEIAPFNMEEATLELERCIKELGFVGWLTHSNFGVEGYLDDKKYWPLLEVAESLEIPIYLHPTIPMMPEFGKYGFASAGPALGFQFDTALCLMRMMLSGVFDQFPKLQIILGHLGETMPYLMERLDFSYTNPGLSQEPEFAKLRPKINRFPSQILRENVYVATSGRFYTPALDYAVKAMGESRILLATDYPMESFPDSIDFVKKSGLPTSVIQKICSENAKQLGIT